MTSSNSQKWEPCSNPQIGDTLKWNEPLWAPPHKPRGKPDKIGEQEIIALLVNIKDVLEFKVISVTNISSSNAPLKVQKNDDIKRKKSSVEKGNCYKLT